MTAQADIEKMRQRIDEARRVEEELLGIDAEDEKEEEAGIQPRFISECFRLNERGDGILFAALHKDRLVYVQKLSTWLYWAGNHWKLDEEDISVDAADEVAQQYERYAAILKSRSEELIKEDKHSDAKVLTELIKKYKTRINKLRTLKGARVCVDYSHRIGNRSLSIIGEELDQKQLLLACPNAVVDLNTGEVVDSKPGDYILKAISTPWKGLNEPCPKWDKFFATIHQNDPEVMQLVHTMLGYAITGLRTEHFIGCFIGEGRNGKGTMFETIRAILGDLGWTISSELLLEQRFTRSSAGPSPDLFSLMGRRMVIASETEDNARISAAQVKRLTGGDSIKTRAPHEKMEINFLPTHKLFLYTNHTPHGLAKDYALYKRLLFLEYPLKFVDNPKEPNERKRDPDLPKKFAEEASGILAWLVRGALLWKAERGLHPPPKVQASIDAIRLQDDVILQFFNETIDKADPDQFLKFADVFNKFKEFYIEVHSDDLRWLPTKRKFSNWFQNHGYKKDKRGGAAIIYGINFKPREDNDVYPG